MVRDFCSKRKRIVLSWKDLSIVQSKFASVHDTNNWESVLNRVILVKCYNEWTIGGSMEINMLCSSYEAFVISIVIIT